MSTNAEEVVEDLPDSLEELSVAESLEDGPDFDQSIEDEIGSFDDEFASEVVEDKEESEAKAEVREEVVPPKDEDTEEEDGIASLFPDLEEAEETPATTDEPTGDEEQSALQLTREEMIEVLQRRGSPETTEEAPASQEPEAEGTSNPQEAWKAAHQTYVDQYALSEDDAAAMYTEPETVLPRMAADITMRTIQAVIGLLPQYLPKIEEQNAQAAAVETARREAMDAALGGVEVKDNQLEAAQDMVRKLSPGLDVSSPADFAKATAGVLQRVLGVKKPGGRVAVKPRALAAGRGAGKGPPAPVVKGDNPYGDFFDEDMAEDNR